MSTLTLPRTRAVPIAYAYGLIGVVGTTVLAVSAYYLHDLALAVRMPEPLAWSLPITLDLGAAAGAVCWILADNGTRFFRWGLGVALSCLAGTLAGNALAHLIDMREISVTPWLVVATCSVFPVTLFAIVHLVLLLRDEQSATAEQLVEDASPIDQEPDPAPAEPLVMEEAPRVPADTSNDGSADASESPAPRRRRISTPATRRRWIAAELDEGRDVTGGQVERRFTSRNGAREVAQVKAERAASSEQEVA